MLQWTPCHWSVVAVEVEIGSESFGPGHSRSRANDVDSRECAWPDSLGDLVQVLIGHSNHRSHLRHTAHRRAFAASKASRRPTGNVSMTELLPRSAWQ